jgi:pilus assembly protein CpaE
VNANATPENEYGTGRMSALSVLLIGPDYGRRRALGQAFLDQQVTIAGELGAYPNLSSVLKLTKSGCDVVVVDLDGDADVALDLVEDICSHNPALTVMVYSRNQEAELLVRCMRAGARELLTEPLKKGALVDAIVRASARRTEVDRQRKVAGRILVFRGAKGGSGVTTVASNFAVALKKESGKDVVLVDLNLELGDAGVVLGLKPDFSLKDALRNSSRLDQDFLSSLLAEHESGLWVLTAPDDCGAVTGIEDGTLGKLLYILRDRFPFVVVDAGPSLGPAGNVVFEMADLVYLVMQVDIPALRNVLRLIASIQASADAPSRIELVLNRYDPRKLEIEEGQIAKVLALPLKWKIPNDYAAVRRSLDAGVPLVSGKSPVAQALLQMAREACGKVSENGKKKRFGLFG